MCVRGLGCCRTVLYVVEPSMLTLFVLAVVLLLQFSRVESGCDNQGEFMLEVGMSECKHGKL